MLNNDIIVDWFSLEKYCKDDFHRIERMDGRNQNDSWKRLDENCFILIKSGILGKCSPGLILQ